MAHGPLLKKADRLYKELAYAKAIPYYKSAYEKKGSSYALIKLANCYRLTNRSLEAEEAYKKVLVLPEKQDIHLFYYADVLLANQKYKEAAVWLKMYLDLKPDSRIATDKLEFCQNIKTFQKDAGNYKLSLLPMNTEASEFSPSFYKNGIVYVTETR